MYKFCMPTIVYHEDNCVENHQEVFKSCGKKAIIVTGQHSAKASGALDNIITVLNANGILYTIFNKVESNPSIETVEKASILAKSFGADFIIGIGGGSPIDAAKSIAVLAVNEMTGEELFNNNFEKVLPIIAIPTTVGTGTEVTPYSVLVNKKKNSKFSFGVKETFPNFALLDAKYIESLRLSTLIATAVDAFTHSVEGYLCNRANPLSDALALEGIKIFGNSLKELQTGDISKVIRDKLLYASTLGGIVIAHTGVTIVHGMGYCYTYYKDIPHGVANGFLLPSLLNYLQEARRDKIQTISSSLGCKSIEELRLTISKLIGNPPDLSVEEINLYTKQSMLQKGSINNTPTEVDEMVIKKLWEVTC